MFLVRAASTHLSSRTDPKRVLVLGLLAVVAACHAAPRPAAVPASRATDARAQLQRDIDAVLAAPALARSYWGILVKSARDDDTLYALNANKLVMPGSTMKIATLAAAAERLGWNYTFDTRLVAMGPIESGTLDGDLLVIGSGDPSIVEGETGASGAFAEWASALKASGVRTIAGRIIGDDNSFDDQALGPGWAWDDLAGRDAVGVSGLQYNENIAQATIRPGPRVGAPATVALTPAGNDLEVDNQVVTGQAGTLPSIVASRSAGSSRLQLAGSMPLSGEPLGRNVSVNNPTLFFVRALREALTAAGIEIRGAAVDVDDLSDLPQPDKGRELFVHHSPPLSTLAGRLMKNSVNLYAETLFKTLGGTSGAPTFEGGRMATTATLESWGVDPAGIIQVDGSGLSRYNYITAETLVAVLMHVYRDDRMREPFEASLPIAGRDGTLALRMKDTAAEGNVRAKSGTLANVRSLAGYATSANGEPLVFALVANNYGTMPEVAVTAIDAIVVKLAEFRR